MQNLHFLLRIAPLLLFAFLAAACSAPQSTSIVESQRPPFAIAGLPLAAPTLSSRVATMENPTGARGAGGTARAGRKGSPSILDFPAGERAVLLDTAGPGCVRRIWMTLEDRSPATLRNVILRIYWDNQQTPSVEAPIADFFGLAHGHALHTSSAFLATPNGRGFNAWFPMPFGERARITLTNETGALVRHLYYEVDYTLGDPVAPDTPRFHAQFRRTPRTTLKQDYVILDGVEGRGRFLGCVVGIVDHYPGGSTVWWGEGEVKMYLDGDRDFPTICGTGAEDYIGTGWGLEPYQLPEMGAPYVTDTHASFYRWHTRDPIYFQQSIRVTLQQLGNDNVVHPRDANDPLLGEFVKSGRYLKESPGGVFERSDDVCSTAYWYQTLPTQPFPPLPPKTLRELDLPIPPPTPVTP